MVKIAISLPDEVFDAIEKERLASGVSRSAFFRQAAEEHLRRQQQREAVDQYIRGYQQYPETAEEIAMAEVTMRYALADNPWEDDLEG